MKNPSHPGIKDTMQLLRPDSDDMAAVIQNFADGIIIVTADGVIGFTNPRAEAILGAAPGTLAGRKWDISR